MVKVEAQYPCFIGFLSPPNLHSKCLTGKKLFIWVKTVHLSLDVMAVSPWGLYTDGVAGSSEVKNKWKYPGFTAQLLLICWNHGSCHLWDPHVVERKKQKEAGAGEWLPMGGPFWGSPQFVQLCWCLMSAPSSKQQWEGIPMKSNMQDCISLCALWVVQKQVKYWKKTSLCYDCVHS